MDMTDYFFSALSLVFVLEGIMPFLAPRMYRKMMRRLSEQDDRSMRYYGLAIMLVGVAILYIIHQ